jgi:peptide/nickel transport system substrate-binding protein
MFADKKLRQALVQAIDRNPIVQTSYGGLVPAQKGFWIDKLFPPSLDPISDSFDTAPLKALVANLPDKNVDLAWGADGGAPVQQMAELVQTQLAAVGLNATVRQLPTAQVFDLANQPQAKRPDLFVDWLGGDALHLDTVLRIMLRTGAKPLNLFSFSFPELDKLMDEAILQPTMEKTNAVYVEATKFVMDQAIFVPFCAQPFPIIARNYLTGIVQDSDFPEIIDAGKIGRKLS